MTGLPPKVVDIYTLCDPTTGEIRYIGKANSAKKRLASHLRDCRRRRTPLYCWLRKLIAAGNLPKVIVLEVVPYASWPEAEKRLIAEHRGSSRLLNLADGGDEPYCAKEVRARNGRANAQARTANPFKTKVYTLKREMGRMLKKGLVSEASKEKLRYAARKRPDLFGIWADI